MFIPRTLAQDDPRAGRGLARALIVIVLVAAALFLVLSANITVGQENLEVGEIAPRDIRAQRDTTFTSESRTEEAAGPGRRRGRSGHRDDQVADGQPGGPAPRLRHDDPAGRPGARPARPRLARGRRGDRPAGERRAGHPVRLAPAGRRDGHRSLGDGRGGGPDGPRDDPRRSRPRGGPVRGPRNRVRDLVTTDLEGAERELAGALAAAFVAATEITDEEATAEQIAQARDEVPPVEVTVQAGQRDRQRGRPDHRRAVRDARRARPDPAAGGGRDGLRAADRGAAHRLAAGRLPVALRAGDLVPQSVRPALLPRARGQRGGDADRGRPHAPRVRRADHGHGAAARHPPARRRRRGDGRRPRDPRRRDEPRRARADRLRPRRRAGVAAGDHPRRAAQRVRPRLLRRRRRSRCRRRRLRGARAARPRGAGPAGRRRRLQRRRSRLRSRPAPSPCSATCSGS